MPAESKLHRASSRAVAHLEDPVERGRLRPGKDIQSRRPRILELRSWLRQWQNRESAYQECELQRIHSPCEHGCATV